MHDLDQSKTRGTAELLPQVFENALPTMTCKPVNAYVLAFHARGQYQACRGWRSKVFPSIPPLQKHDIGFYPPSLNPLHHSETRSPKHSARRTFHLSFNITSHPTPVEISRLRCYLFAINEASPRTSIERQVALDTTKPWRRRLVGPNPIHDDLASIRISDRPVSGKSLPLAKTLLCRLNELRLRGKTFPW